MSVPIRLDRAAVLGCIPHGEPFAFVDAAEVLEGEARGVYKISGSECFMSGHFPGRPVFPASILVEALGQLAIVYMLQRYRSDEIDPESIYFIKSEDVKCSRKCLPGDLLEMSVCERRVREPLMVFTGEIRVGGELAMKVSSITLSFSTGNAALIAHE